MLRSALLLVYPHFDEKFDRFIKLAPETKVELLTHGFFARMPYVIFCMVPVFALFLKLLYLPSRRRYGEYLLFSLHVNAFAFFVMILMHLMPSMWGVAALMLILLLYLGVAMHRIYGGAAAATAVRWLVLIGAYFFMLTTVLIQLMTVLAMTAA